jgi:prolyl oligopeptidase
MKRFQNTILALLLLVNSQLYAQPLKYPESKKANTVDNYFGTEVADPYRWMEDDQANLTKLWVNAENKVTQDYLAQIPFRDSLKSKMKELWSFIRYQTPFRSGDNYLYYRQDPNSNQPMLFYMRSLRHVPMSLLDVNKLSADGTVSFTQTSPSKDGIHVAFQVAESGSDWNKIRIKEVKTLKSLPEVLIGIKFSNISWWKDGFFYSRYEIPSNENMLTAKNENHKVYYHKLNTEQSQDSLVFEDKEHPLRSFNAIVSDNDRYLIISGSESTSGNNILIKDLLNPNKPAIKVVEGFENDFEFIGFINENAVFFTNYNAPKKKLILINPEQPLTKNWKDLVPEQTEILQSAAISINEMVLHYMKDASSRLYVFSKAGQKLSEIPLKGFGTVDEMNSSSSDSIIWFSYTTFTSPNTIYYFNTKNNRLYEKYSSKLTIDPADFETKQLFYKSKDGTRIPMFIVHKKGIKLDGNNPTLLFGYGGFNISKTPEFKTERLVFLNAGGVFVMANIRGGGEYGTDWHQAGTKLKKQNVFDDFIAAAEFLIKEKYTNPSKLAISGRSNGGLLIGAVMTQRPELFKVALPAVGVMDMLRFHKFTIGWAWKTDFGSSEDSTEFKAIYKYSPLHNIKEGVNYPATIVTTGDHDDRVVPAHSYKFIATLQEKYRGNNPMLIRIDTNAGHGSGKPISKLIDEQADIFTFLFYNLGMTL